MANIDDLKNGLQKSISEQLERLSRPAFPDFNYAPSTTRLNELMKSIKPLPQARADRIQETIRQHIEGLQNKLAADEQLVILFQ
jgi:hypothetical protein